MKNLNHNSQNEAIGEEKYLQLPSRLAWWLLVAFVGVEFFALELIVFVRLFNDRGTMPLSSVLHWTIAGILAPLMMCFMALRAYRRVKRVALEIGPGTEVLDVAVRCGLELLGFAFLAVFLAILS